jgi:hypothetical protein
VSEHILADPKHDEPPLDCNGDHDYQLVNYDPSVGLFGNLECRNCGDEKDWDGHWDDDNDT